MNERMIKMLVERAGIVQTMFQPCGEFMKFSPVGGGTALVDRDIAEKIKYRRWYRESDKRGGYIYCKVFDLGEDERRDRQEFKEIRLIDYVGAKKGIRFAGKSVTWVKNSNVHDLRRQNVFLLLGEDFKGELTTGVLYRLMIEKKMDINDICRYTGKDALEVSELVAKTGMTRLMHQVYSGGAIHSASLAGHDGIK